MTWASNKKRVNIKKYAHFTNPQLPEYRSAMA